MLIALMADIHANREALEACLAHAQARRAERCIFLGDYVGYGADPEWVVEKVEEHVAKGGVAILGNHDAAVGERGDVLGAPAQAAMDWTRVQLGAGQRAFLAGLPLAHEEEGRLFVHAEASAPRRWTYVRDANDASRSIRATACRTTFCGHVHSGAIYNMSEMWQNMSDMWKLTAGFRPVPGVAVPLLPSRRWHCVLGSVGQPRDGNPAAAYAILDTARSEVTYHRVPYDTGKAAAKVVAAGLGEALAVRLRDGR